MPYAFNNGVRLYWEHEGEGDPLLMIMGLGFPLAMWRDLRSCMARQFRTIVFDNRGVGKSDVWLRPFSIPAMARDAICVMDAAGVRSAHVLGLSMGGMIAQELALLFPNRVQRLVLGCKACKRNSCVREASQRLLGCSRSLPTTLRSAEHRHWEPRRRAKPGFERGDRSPPLPNT